MDLNQFNTHSLQSMGEAVFSCSCGQTHQVATDSIYFGSEISNKIIEAMEKTLPPLSGISILSDDTVRDATIRKYEKILSRSGYRVHTYNFKIAYSGNLTELAEYVVPEDIRLILGVGGGNVLDMAKYKAKALNIGCALVATSPSCIGALVPSSMLFDGVLEQVYKVDSPKFLMCDTQDFTSCSSTMLANAFGYVASKLVSLFDYKFASIANNENFCDVLFEQGVACIDQLIDSLSPVPKLKQESAIKIADASLRYSLLAQMNKSSRLTNGSESQVAHALKLLYKYEEQDIRMTGENEFLLARILIKLYKNYLQFEDKFFLPPPDNNKRIDSIKMFFGIDNLTAIKRLKPIVSGIDVKVINYRMSEYREELYKLAEEFDQKLNKAWKIFKRLYDDDGYSIINYLQQSDVSLCMALAPDLKEKYTTLTYLKNQGVLDTYLIDLD